MKQNKFYKYEMRCTQKLGALLDRVPDPIMYGAIAVITFITILISL